MFARAVIFPMLAKRHMDIDMKWIIRFRYILGVRTFFFSRAELSWIDYMFGWIFFAVLFFPIQSHCLSAIYVVVFYVAAVKHSVHCLPFVSLYFINFEAVFFGCFSSLMRHDTPSAPTLKLFVRDWDVHWLSILFFSSLFFFHLWIRLDFAQF